ncbi:hypothetical protein [Chryseobacterium sp. JUb7]|uniref:hypothetical protein n=1 Tax=Chryseobacterium sp. JUb7 TaxID=2940599 RepID=UPI00216A3E2A|nr:hypothetical protein [Chryseobacterium sp. JUb7]MCS3533047.1 hypothetical protein [Chryseobacterium sp. JUb7]
MKKINVTELENLSIASVDEILDNRKIIPEASGEGSFYIYETKDNTISTIFVSKKDFKIVGITENITNIRENTNDFYTYNSEGLLQKYVKSQNTETIHVSESDEIAVQRYVKIIEKFNQGELYESKNYDECFKIDIQSIINVIKENSYQNGSIYRIYLDDDLTGIPVIGLTPQDFELKKSYWVLKFRESLNSNEFIFRIYDGVHGDFLKQKSSKIFNNL